MNHSYNISLTGKEEKACELQKEASVVFKEWHLDIVDCPDCLRKMIAMHEAFVLILRSHMATIL